MEWDLAVFGWRVVEVERFPPVPVHQSGSDRPQGRASPHQPPTALPTLTPNRSEEAHKSGEPGKLSQARARASTTALWGRWPARERAPPQLSPPQHNYSYGIVMGALACPGASPTAATSSSMPSRSSCRAAGRGTGGGAARSRAEGWDTQRRRRRHAGANASPAAVEGGGDAKGAWVKSGGARAGGGRGRRWWGVMPAVCSPRRRSPPQ